MKHAQIIFISIVLIWALTSIILVRLQAKRIRGQAMQLAAEEKKLAEAEQERLRAMAGGRELRLTPERRKILLQWAEEDAHGG